jgi:hypothetical protein
MSRQVILHIGYPKTGTTALQRFWHLNQTILRDSGLLYPEAGLVGAAHFAYSYQLGLHDSIKMDVPPFEALITALRAEMDQSGLQRALLSSEAFIKAANPEPLRAAFDGFDVKILIYLRRHDHFFESGYSQSVRSATSPRQDSSIGSFILYQLGRGQLSYDYLARRSGRYPGARTEHPGPAQQRHVPCHHPRHRRGPARRGASRLQARHRRKTAPRRPWHP